MKKFWFKKLLVISMFAITILYFPFYTEASSKYINFLPTKNIFIFVVLLLWIFFWAMYISQHRLHKKTKPIDLKNSPTIKYPIIIQYEPPKWINSAEVWLLLYRRSDPISIITLIYKRLWAWLISMNIKESPDYIKKNKKTTYIIQKIKEPSEMAPSYELLFWKSFFDAWDCVEIDNNADLYLDESLRSLEERWYKKWWFVKDDSIDKWSLIIMSIIVILIVLLFITPHTVGKDGIMTAIIFVLYIILFSFPKLWIIVSVDVPKFKEMKTTEKGDDLIYHILWFKKFLETCDANILKTFLKKDPLYFDKVLPYAIIFWIESELIEKFRPLIDDSKLTFYIQEFKNPFYNALRNIADNSTPIKKWTSPNIGNNWDNSYSSDSWFISWSSFSWWWSSFSSWWGGGWWGWRSW